MDNQKNLLVIIDMVNGFIEEGALHNKNIKSIVPNIKRYIERAIKNDAMIIVFCDNHSMSDEEFKHYPPHCLKGTSEAELIQDFKIFEPYIFKNIPKNTINGFITPEFQELLKKHVFDKVVVTGCLTDICVETFASNYKKYIKRNGLKTQIIIPEDAVYALNQETQPENQINALKRMQELGIHIVTAKMRKSHDTTHERSM